MAEAAPATPSPSSFLVSKEDPWTIQASLPFHPARSAHPIRSRTSRRRSSTKRLWRSARAPALTSRILSTCLGCPRTSPAAARRDRTGRVKAPHPASSRIGGQRPAPRGPGEAVARRHADGAGVLARGAAGRRLVGLEGRPRGPLLLPRPSRSGSCPRNRNNLTTVACSAPAEHAFSLAFRSLSFSRQPAHVLPSRKSPVRLCDLGCQPALSRLKGKSRLAGCGALF
jgi:hypothetical protein